MAEQNPPAQPDRGPELKRPDQAVKDLEPDQQEGDAVKGGNWDSRPPSKQG